MCACARACARTNFRSTTLQSIIAQYNQLEMKRARLTQSIKEFLRSNRTPAELERKILKWVSFDFEVKQKKEVEDMALSHVPAELRRSLVAHLHRDMLFRVPFLRNIQNFRREDFLVDLFACMEPVTFCKNLPVATRDHTADRLLCVTHGLLKMVLYDGTSVATINPGDMIGEYALLGDETYRTCHGLPCEYFAMSYVTCLMLKRGDFEVILSCYDTSLRQEILAARAQWQIKQASQERWVETLMRQAHEDEAAAVSRRIVLLSRWAELANKARMRREAQSFGRAAQRMKLSVLGGWGAVVEPQQQAGPDVEAIESSDEDSEDLEHRLHREQTELLEGLGLEKGGLGLERRASLAKHAAAPQGLKVLPPPQKKSAQRSGGHGDLFGSASFSRKEQVARHAADLSTIAASPSTSANGTNGGVAHWSRALSAAGDFRVTGEDMVLGQPEASGPAIVPAVPRSDMAALAETDSPRSAQVRVFACVCVCVRVCACFA